MRFTGKTFADADTFLGEAVVKECDNVQLARTTSGSIVLNLNGETVAGLMPSGEIAIVVTENTQSVRHRINQVLPPTITLRSKSKALFLEVSQLETHTTVHLDKYALIGVGGEIQTDRQESS